MTKAEKLAKLIINNSCQMQDLNEELARLEQVDNWITELQEILKLSNRRQVINWVWGE